ncbi:MAG TPA: phenylacetate--CoA ligase family protein [Bacteroidales bacterium]|nr:phenylacetate--CoA ligase family protein [Bacteroidales bacterium]
MVLFSLLSKKLILPISDLVTGNSISKQLSFLEKSQFWTRDQLKEYQDSKLRSLVHHAYLNVPFYRNLFDDIRIKPEDIQTREDLVKLPIITKEDLKKSKGKHLATNIKSKDLVFASSSGSTGEPFQFYKTKASESFLTAAALRGWNWMGYKLGDPYVKVSMNPRSSIIKKIQDFVNNSLYLSSTQLNPEEFLKIVKDIDKFNPDFIRCYPIPLYFLANQIEAEHGSYKGKNLKAINTTGSTLSDKVRLKVEDVFGVKIFDSYSCEGGAVFYECSDHKYYHPAEEYAIQEYISDSYTLSDPEKPLRHITTDLHNYASPFIRYDTQDYVVLGDDKSCTCGKQYSNIKKIKGRDGDILVTPAGKYLIVENFVAYFEWITEVDQIQVIQNRLDEIHIKMIVNTDFTKNTLKKIQDYWQNYIGLDVHVICEVADKIELTPTGKRRTIIRNPLIKLNHGL